MINYLTGGFDPLPNQHLIEHKQEFDQPGLVIKQSIFLLKYQLLNKNKKADQIVIPFFTQPNPKRDYNPRDLSIE
jgi:hypothetical protein